MTRDSDHILAQLLDECVQRLLDGEPIEDCLSRYPEHAPALAPLLRSVESLRGLAAVPSRSLDVADQARARFLAAAQGGSALQGASETQGAPTPQVAAAPQALPPMAVTPTVAGRNGQPRPTNPRRQSDAGVSAWRARFVAAFSIWRPLPAGLLAVALCIVLVGALTTGMVTVSASALPGDPLYSIKLMAEQARLLLAVNEAARDSLDEQIQTERVSEAETILKMKRPVDVMPIAGKLLSFDDKTWNVSGLLVAVNDQTSIVGTPAVGALVRGSAQAPGDGTLVASYLNTQQPGATVGQPTGTRKPGAGAAGTSTPTAPTSTAHPTRRAVSQPLGSPTPTQRPPTRTSRPSAIPRSAKTAVTGSALVLTPTVMSVETVSVSPTLSREDGSLDISGKVLSLQADSWVIAGHTIYRNRQTLVLGDVSVGDFVRVRATRAPDGRMMAQSVTLQADTPTSGHLSLTATVIPTESSPAGTPLPQGPGKWQN